MSYDSKPSQPQMLAAWYTNKGPAHSVLNVGKQPIPNPKKGEVRIKLKYSGISPGDVKKRSGWKSSPMTYPLVIPHSDGVGIIDSVGEDVEASRVGEIVWCYGAQSYRALGTSAQYVVVPDNYAVSLPKGLDESIYKQAAGLGIAGITAYYAVFADSAPTDLTGKYVLVYGAKSGVGLIAAQLALAAGAVVVAAIRNISDENISNLKKHGITKVVGLDDSNLFKTLQETAPMGFNQIVEVDFSGHIELNSRIVATNATIATYFSEDALPRIPYWALGFANTTVRFIGSDDFTALARKNATTALTKNLVEGKLDIPIEKVYQLTNIADAHQKVENGTNGKILISLE